MFYNIQLEFFSVDLMSRFAFVMDVGIWFESHAPTLIK